MRFSFVNSHGPRKSFARSLFLLSLGLLPACLARAQSTPDISVPPESHTAVLGSNTVFSVVASGQSPLDFRWYKDGTPLYSEYGRILGANSAQLQLLGVLTNDAGGYWVTVSNRHGMVTSTVATLTVLLPATIASQPRSRAVFAGNIASFSVSASGTSPLYYQWSWNGTALSGETESLLTLTNVQPSAAGSYQVSISNAAAVVQSAAATLEVLPHPAVLVNVDFGEGGFGLKTGPAAAGEGPTDYWNHLGTGGMANVRTAQSQATQTGVSASGANNSLLDWVRSGDPMYDDYIWWTGALSPVAVTDLPPGSYDFYLYSHDTTFQVSSGGVNYGSKNSYEGFPLGNPPVWEEGKQYVSYRNIVVTDPGQPVYINVSRLYQQDGIFSGMQIVCNTPWILEHPSNAIVAVGAVLSLRISAESSTSPDLQWFFNSTPLTDGARVSGAQTRTLVITNAQLADAGDYYVTVSNVNGCKTSSVATVQLGYAARVLQSPSSLTRIAGANAEFSAQSDGTAPVDTQWLLNGSPLSDDGHRLGSATTVLTITNVLESDAGEYALVASNIFGVATSEVAVLTVLLPPSISGQPANQYVIPTRTATFQVAAKGTEPLSYQWLFNSNALPAGGRFTGTFSPALKIESVGSNDIGEYTVVVSNEWGSVTSSVATLSLATTRYVNANNASPAAPYTSWATAATVTQDAINAAGPGDEILVTNGTYTAGSVSAGKPYYASHRVALNKPLSVISVNGPEVTTIAANQYPYPAWGQRCAYLTTGAVLAGFTLTAGDTDLGDTSSENQRGAGVLCQSVNCIVSNCVIAGNVAGRYGGGVYYGTLINCVLSGNTVRDLQGARLGYGGGAYGSVLKNCRVVNNYARYGGGGVMSCTLTNCLLTGNRAVWGAGAYISTMVNCTITGNSGIDDGGLGGSGGGGSASGTLINSIVYGNTCPYGTPNYWGGSMSFCCTFPDPGGVGNISFDPLFTDAAGGNYRLSAISPCINAGTNAALATAIDLDDRPRLVDGTVDIGAYEFQQLPWVVAGPESQDVTLGNTARFSVTIVGEEPLSYQWQKDGTNLVDDLRISGSTGPVLVISNVALGDVGNYRLILSNAWGSASSTFASLSVFLAPSITEQPVSLTVPVLGVTNFSILASGSPPISYQWRKEGTNLADGGWYYGVATPSLQVIGGVPGALGNYDVVVSNPYGAVTSAVVTLSVLPLAINSQPASQTVPAGTNATLAVGAVSTNQIHYQWRFAGTDLPGATNYSLLITNVQSWHAGDYQAIVTNDYCALTSAVATLTVLPASPTILTQPVSRVASVAQTIVLDLVAKGSEPLRFQWQRNGTDLAGATQARLLLTNANCGLTGTYRCMASNFYGVNWTTNFAIVVSPVLVWGMTNNPQFGVNAQIPFSATNVIAIAAGISGSSAACLALRSDRSLLSWGAMREAGVPATATDVVSISLGGTGGQGYPNYAVVRGDGAVVGWMPFTVGQSSLVTNGPFVAAAAGGLHQLGLRDDGTVFAWGNNTYGQTNVPPGATNVVAIAAGQYHCVALRADGRVIAWGSNTNGQVAAVNNASNVVSISAGAHQSLALLRDGTVIGSVATNTSGKSPIFGPAPLDWTNMISIAAGENHALAVRTDGTVAGTGFTNYGKSVPPAFAANAVAVAAGSYHSLALVTDPFSPPMPPQIGRPPLGRTAVAGSDVVFNALAIGELPLSYYWLRDGKVAPGQTRSSLYLANVMPTDAGNYQLVASNRFGVVTSAVAQVSVTIPEPQLRPVAVVSNCFTLQFQSLAGVLYVTEYSTTVAGGAWTELDRRFGTGGLETITDCAAINPDRYYRVRPIFVPVPSLGAPQRTGNSWTIECPTVIGANYVVQHKTNLSDPVWLELMRFAGTGGHVMVVDTNAPGPSRFYRVKVE